MRIIGHFWFVIGRRIGLMRERWRDAGYTDSEKRGVNLLREWLSPKQRAQFERHAYFDVTGSHTGKQYRIRYGLASNIWELDSYGHVKTGWCVVPKGELVPGDVMLAQKIALETDELAVLTVARRFRPIWH